MTTGSLSSTQVYPHVVLYNGSPLKNGQHGYIGDRVWAGLDSPEFRKPHWEWRNYDTTRLVRGKIVPVRRKYRHYFEPVRATSKAENPYDLQATRISMPLVELKSIQYFSDGSSNLHGVWTNCSVEDLFSGNQIPEATIGPQQAIDVLQSLQERVSGSDFNTAVFLAEGSEACNMIADAAIKLNRAYRFARKGNFVDAAHTLYSPRRFPPRAQRKKLASSWLELQYGWLPLLSDMKAGAEQLAHHLALPFKKKVKASRTWDYTGRPTYLNSNRNPGALPIGGWQVEFADCYSVASRQIVANLSEPLSVPQFSGLLDPELVAWELVPFSFVVDWFAPVGDWLSARAFVAKLQGTFVVTDTIRVHATGFRRATFRDPSVPGFDRTEITPLNGGIASCAFERVLLHRSVTQNLAIPSLPKVTSLDSALSFRRCVNAIALLAVGLKLPPR